MLTVQSLNPDKRLAVTIAIFFAEDVLSFWEAEFFEDMRPRKAIEAAKEWLANPCEKTADAASLAASLAASRAADAAANAASRAAYDAAALAASRAAYDAALAAAYAAALASVVNASRAAAYAAYAATSAASTARCSFYVHNKLAQLLPHLFEYKVFTKTSFKDSEKIFDLLSEKNQQRFLFNLDRLR